MGLLCITDATGKPQVGVSLDKNTLQSLFKSTIHLEDGERSINNTREISSVVMTTGGYISPAIEGKMPEAIIPDIISKLSYAIHMVFVFICPSGEYIRIVFAFFFF